MIHPIRLRQRAAAVTAITAWVTACSPDTPIGDAQRTALFHRGPSQSAAEAAAQPASLLPKGATPWWKSFDDRVLNRLVDTALEKNFRLDQVASRVLQADAELRKARGRLFPTLDGTGRVEKRWVDSDLIDSSDSTRSASLAGLLSWEIDVWGRLRNAVADRTFERAAAVADWHGARLILSAAVTEVYFEILEQQQQLRLINEQITTG